MPKRLKQPVLTSQESQHSFASVYQTKLKSVDLDQIKVLIKLANLLIICDEKLNSLYPGLFADIDKERIWLIKAGEKYKNQTAVNRIHNFLTGHNANRSSPILVIGGGTVCDTAAFAVSTYKRGGSLILLPTTLLAMVDAAIGGKTGINLRDIKNQLGTFYPASEVWLCTGFLSTLPAKERKEGYVEMQKMWFIDPLLPLPECNLNALISSSQIYEYAFAKLRICTSDLQDNGQRRLLNLGHSFGHALESSSKYRISHGKAVAFGMHIAALISLKMGYIDHEIYQQILLHIHNTGYHLDLSSRLSDEFILSLPNRLGQDKKNTSDWITLILFKGLNKVFVAEHITPQQITTALSDGAPAPPLPL